MDIHGPGACFDVRDGAHRIVVKLLSTHKIDNSGEVFGVMAIHKLLFRIFKSELVKMMNFHIK